MKLKIRITRFDSMGSPVKIDDKDHFEKEVEVESLRPVHTDEALDIGINLCRGYGPGIYDVEVLNPREDDALVRFRKLLPQ